MNRFSLGVFTALLLITWLPPIVAQEKKGAGLPESEQMRRIELLERRLSAMSDLVLQVDALQREVQQLRGEIELQNHAMDALKKRQRDLYLDVDQRLNQLSHGSAPMTASPQPGATQVETPQQSVVDPSMASAPPVSATATSPVPAVSPATSQQASSAEGIASTTPQPQMVPATGSDAQQPAMGAEPEAAPIDPAAEEADYKQAFGLLMQRRYDEARDAFKRFLEQYKNGSYADNAQYWLAEASYVTRDFAVALPEFQKVINDYPNSSKVPDAMLKSSFIHYENKEWQQARELLQSLVTLYPNSTASRLATKRLDRMQSEGH